MRVNLALCLAALLTGLPAGGDTRAPTRFAAATTPLYASPDADARPIGKLFAAARLVALERNDAGWTKVQVPGWTQAGAERALQTAPGLRVTRAALGKAGLETLAFGAARHDPATDLTWTRTQATGWIAPAAETVATLDQLWARAEPLFATRCTACHERRVPARYTANQWTSYLKVMGPRTGLPKDDQLLVRTYLQYRSADAAALAVALAEE